MFNRTYTGPAISRVNRELERALKEVARREETRENREEIEGVVGSEAVNALMGAGYVYLPSQRDGKGYGAYTRIERTIDGRSYFSERRRDWLERNMPTIIGAVIGGMFALIGSFFGYWLGVAQPFSQAQDDYQPSYSQPDEPPDYLAYDESPHGYMVGAVSQR